MNCLSRGSSVPVMVVFGRTVELVIIERIGFGHIFKHGGVHVPAVPNAEHSLAPNLPVQHQDLVACWLIWLR